MTINNSYGPLDIQQKKRKLTQRVVIKKDPSQIKKPETVCDVHESILKIKLYLIPNLVQLEGEQVNVSNEFEKLIESVSLKDLEKYAFCLTRVFFLLQRLNLAELMISSSGWLSAWNDLEGMARKGFESVQVFYQSKLLLSIG